MPRYRGLQVLSYFIELSSFHIYLQSPSGRHDVKEKKALNWHELVQIPALLFNSWPVTWSSLILSFLICEMGPVLTVHLAVRIRDNEHQGPAQSFMHRSYPTRAERSHVHMYKWWSRIRWSFMRDERWEMRALATQQEERWVQDGFMGECVWGEARKWAGYW